jgi:hypothetical protein
MTIKYLLICWILYVYAVWTDRGHKFIVYKISQFIVPEKIYKKNIWVGVEGT